MFALLNTSWAVQETIGPLMLTHIFLLQLLGIGLGPQNWLKAYQNLISQQCSATTIVPFSTFNHACLRSLGV